MAAVLALLGMLGGILGIHRAERRQMRVVTAACQCVCAPVSEADWPLSWSYPGVLVAGETTRGAWGGGALVCLRPDEPQPGARLAEIRRAVEDRNRERRADGGQP